MACAPPTLKMSRTPQARAAATTAGSARPSLRGGVHITRTAQPARRAGTASMIAVEGSGALPAGTYRPTARIGRTTRSHTTPGAVSTRIGAADLGRVKPGDVANGCFDGGHAPPGRLRPAAAAASSSLTRRFVELDPVERRGQAPQGAIAVPPDFVDDPRAPARRPRARARTAGRSRAARRAGSSRRGPVDGLQQARGHGSIFSTGSTSNELAPAFLRFSSVSQKTFSRQTTWTATLSPRPSSGMTVGASAPGSRRAISASADFRRIHHDVLAFAHLHDAVDPLQQARRSSRSFPAGRRLGVWIRIAWLSRMVSPSRSRLAASVEPVETRSQTTSARPRLGAISTAPENSTTLASTRSRSQERLHDAGIARGDPPALQIGDGLQAAVFRVAECQAAAAVIERPDDAEWLGIAVGEELQPPLLQHVHADDSEVADVVPHQAWNVVVAHQQHVDRHVFAETR